MREYMRVCESGCDAACVCVCNVRACLDAVARVRRWSGQQAAVATLLSEDAGACVGVCRRMAGDAAREAARLATDVAEAEMLPELPHGGAARDAGTDALLDRMEEEVGLLESDVAEVMKVIGLRMEVVGCLEIINHGPVASRLPARSVDEKGGEYNGGTRVARGRDEQFDRLDCVKKEEAEVESAAAEEAKKVRLGSSGELSRCLHGVDQVAELRFSSTCTSWHKEVHDAGGGQEAKESRCVLCGAVEGVGNMGATRCVVCANSPGSGEARRWRISVHGEEEYLQEQKERGEERKKTDECAEGEKRKEENSDQQQGQMDVAEERWQRESAKMGEAEERGDSRQGNARRKDEESETREPPAATMKAQEVCSGCCHGRGARGTGRYGTGSFGVEGIGTRQRQIVALYEFEQCAESRLGGC